MAVGVDLTDPALYEHGDPHSVWRELRQSGELAWHDEADGPGFWSATRYDHASAIYRDAATFSSARGTLLGGDRRRPDPAGNRMLGLSDPPRHTELRRALHPLLDRRAADTLEDGVRTLVRGLLSERAGAGPFDFVADVATVVPIHVVSDLLGLPVADAPFLHRATRRALSADADERSAADQELLLYAFDFVDEAGNSALPSLMGRALGGLAPNELQELVALNLYNLVSAGSDTTRLAISGGALALAEHPSEWERLRENPSLVPAAVEEILRWTTPTLHFLRTVTGPTSIGSTRLSPGEQIAVWNPSVNRDEAVFESPETFAVARTPNRHLAFGTGPHACIGARLARLELRVLLQELVATTQRLCVAGPVERLRSLVLHGVDRLPLELT